MNINSHDVLTAHGYALSSESESDEDVKTDFDEIYRSFKPPPLDYETIKHRVVIIKANKSRKNIVAKPKSYTNKNVFKNKVAKSIPRPILYNIEGKGKETKKFKNYAKKRISKMKISTKKKVSPCLEKTSKRNILEDFIDDDISSNIFISADKLGFRNKQKNKIKRNPKPERQINPKKKKKKSMTYKINNQNNFWHVETPKTTLKFTKQLLKHTNKTNILERKKKMPIDLNENKLVLTQPAKNDKSAKKQQKSAKVKLGWKINVINCKDKSAITQTTNQIKVSTPSWPEKNKLPNKINVLILSKHQKKKLNKQIAESNNEQISESKNRVESKSTKIKEKKIDCTKKHFVNISRAGTGKTLHGNSRALVRSNHTTLNIFSENDKKQVAAVSQNNKSGKKKNKMMSEITDKNHIADASQTRTSAKKELRKSKIANVPKNSFDEIKLSRKQNELINSLRKLGSNNSQNITSEKTSKNSSTKIDKPPTPTGTTKKANNVNSIITYNKLGVQEFSHLQENNPKQMVNAAEENIHTYPNIWGLLKANNNIPPNIINCKRVDGFNINTNISDTTICFPQKIKVYDVNDSCKNVLFEDIKSKKLSKKQKKKKRSQNQSNANVQLITDLNQSKSRDINILGKVGSNNLQNVTSEIASKNNSTTIIKPPIPTDTNKKANVPFEDTETKKLSKKQKKKLKKSLVENQINSNDQLITDLNHTKSKDIKINFNSQETNLTQNESRGLNNNIYPMTLGCDGSKNFTIKDSYMNNELNVGFEKHITIEEFRTKVRNIIDCHNIEDCRTQILSENCIQNYLQDEQNQYFYNMYEGIHFQHFMNFRDQYPQHGTLNKKTKKRKRNKEKKVTDNIRDSIINTMTEDMDKCFYYYYQGKNYHHFFNFRDQYLYGTLNKEAEKKRKHENKTKDVMDNIKGSKISEVSLEGHMNEDLNKCFYYYYQGKNFRHFFNFRDQYLHGTLSKEFEQLKF